MSNRPLISLLLLICVSGVRADIKMNLGDGLIDGTNLEPYQLTWQQCALQDGQWQIQGTLTEELVVIGELVLRHRQTTQNPDGIVSQSDTYFDRSTFAPLRMEMEATMNGSRIAYQERRLGADGYTGIAIKGANSKQLQGTINSNMLHGGAMGLPLATMDYHDEPVGFLASMIAFDGTYDVIARWVDKDTLRFEERDVEAWLIDVEWHHRESGDLYPAGPDASGGRYWIVPDPPDGFPYVPRYKTDTYAVEFIAGVCPAASPAS